MTDRAGRARADLVRLAGELVARGLVEGTSGNLSARLAAGGFVITPSGLPWAGLRPGDVVEVDAAGVPVAAVLRPSSDTPNHVAIYAARPDVGGIVHTHSPHATAFAVSAEPIPAVLLEAAGYLGGGVRVADFLAPTDPGSAERLARALAGDRAILLPNHGVYAVGETVEAAFAAAAEVESMAHVAWLARAIGPARDVPTDEVERFGAFLHEGYGQPPEVDARAPESSSRASESSPSAPSERLRFLRRVRQVREFTSEPVAREALDAIVDVGRWTGSSRNEQAWRFVVVRDPATIAAIHEAGLPQTRALATAPALVAIDLPDEPERDVARTYDDGRAAERLLIAANVLGLGAAIMFVRRDVRDAVQRRLGVPDGRYCRTIVAIGHPTEAARVPKSPPGQARRPRGETAFEERFPPDVD